VSEIMLQQTRVEAVREYYRRWMERFPTAQSLAEAPEDEVLRYWNGLGYYSRARNLQAGVREVCARYGGQFPQEREIALALPGIGEYTAGAVLSIAYGKRELAVDGNVLRVFSRLCCLPGQAQQQAFRRRVAAAVDAVLPAERPGDFNQAVMDLGATVCIPRQPRCPECPLRELCQAAATGQVNEFPQRQKKKPVPVENLLAGIASWEGKVLLRQRPAQGLLAGMWEFPTVAPEIALTGDGLAAWLAAEVGGCVCLQTTAGTLAHVFSHRIWQLQYFFLEITSPPSALPVGYRWWEPQADPGLALAGPHRKFAHQVLSLLG